MRFTYVLPGFRRDRRVPRYCGRSVPAAARTPIEDGAPDPFASHTVLQGGRPVGMVTSGGYGHRVGRALALAYFTEAADLAAGDLSVLVLGETVKAEVLTHPPYDPDNLRLRDSD